MDESTNEGTRIKLVHGYVVVEQEVDADGRPLRWRRMAITVPVYAPGAPGASLTLNIDLLGQEATPPEFVFGTWPEERGDGK